MQDHKEQWSVKKCSSKCSKTGRDFEDQEIVTSVLKFVDGSFERFDYSNLDDDIDEISGDGSAGSVFVWKTQFRLPIAKEEVVQKENVESLLRKMILKEDPKDQNIIFILAVMLERKKILVERGTQNLENGFKLRVYEHRKSKESFTIIDPCLKLNELEKVQEQVVVLLGGKEQENAQVVDPLE